MAVPVLINVREKTRKATSPSDKIPSSNAARSFEIVPLDRTVINKDVDFALCFNCAQNYS